MRLGASSNCSLKDKARHDVQSDDLRHSEPVRALRRQSASAANLFLGDRLSERLGDRLSDSSPAAALPGLGGPQPRTQGHPDMSERDRRFREWVASQAAGGGGGPPGAERRRKAPPGLHGPTPPAAGREAGEEDEEASRAPRRPAPDCGAAPAAPAADTNARVEALAFLVNRGFDVPAACAGRVDAGLDAPSASEEGDSDSAVVVDCGCLLRLDGAAPLKEDWLNADKESTSAESTDAVAGDATLPLEFSVSTMIPH